MKNIYGMNFFVFCILVLAVVLYFSKNVRDEGFFGMSPGTMDQLSSTRVVSEREQSIDDKIYNNLTRQGIINMTESGFDRSDTGNANSLY